MTLRTATNAATLATALAASIGGDIVECAAGDYGTVSFNGYTFTSQVIVRAAASALVRIKESSANSATKFLRIEGIEFYTVYTGLIDGVPSFEANGSDHVELYGCTHKGDLYFDATDNAWFPGMRGINMWYTTNCLVDHCVIQDCYISFHTLTNDNLTVRHTEITRFGSDGFLWYEDQNFLIDDNKVHAPTGEPSSGGAHLDMCQFQAPGSTRALWGTVQNNIFDATGGIWTQTLFFANENPAIHYGPIAITGNLIYNSFIWGIGGGITDYLTINNNTVVRNFAVPGDPAFPSLDMPQIIVDSGGTGVSLDNNVAHQIQSSPHPETNTTILGYSQAALDAEFDANLTKLPGRLVGKGASIDLLWGGAPPPAATSPPKTLRLGSAGTSLLIAPGKMLIL